MTEKEFSLIVMAMKSYYPKEKLFPTNESMELWYRQLQDIPYQVAEVALNKWVATNKWSPTIADIREAAAGVTYGNIPEWGNGWEQVQKAIRQYGYYNPQKALESMDEITRKCVNRLGFTNLCLSENQAVDRANFRVMYESLANDIKKEAQLSAGIKNEISKLQNKNITENTYVKYLLGIS